MLISPFAGNAAYAAAARKASIASLGVFQPRHFFGRSFRNSSIRRRLRRADRCERGLLGVQAPDQPVRVLVRPRSQEWYGVAKNTPSLNSRAQDISAWPAGRALSNVILCECRADLSEQPDDLGGDRSASLVGTHPTSADRVTRSTSVEMAVPAALAESPSQCPTLMQLHHGGARLDPRRPRSARPRPS